MARKYLQGIYKPTNPAKYVGDVKNIVYRSSYELKMFRWLDTTSSVIKWNSEETIIPYFSPIDQRWHRYFIDVYFEIKDADNKHRRILAEIKPLSQTKPPVIKEGRRLKRSDVEAAKTWAINRAKWKAAITFCKERNLEFTILTERELFGTNQKRRP